MALGSHIYANIIRVAQETTMLTMMQAMQRVLLQETCAESSARIAFRLDDAGDDIGGIDCDDSDDDDAKGDACMSY